MQKDFTLTTSIIIFNIIREDISSYTYFNYNKKKYILKNFFKSRKNAQKN